MKSVPHRSTLVLAALAAALATAPALARDDCEAPVERWQSREAVRQMAAGQGWEIDRLKIDDGCYEIRGTDARGRSFKAKIDPETLQVIKLKQRGDQHDDRKRGRDRERDRDHDAHDRSDRDPVAKGARERDPAALSPATRDPVGVSPSSPLFTPGSASRGQIE